MRGRLGSAHGKNGIQKQHTLTRPAFQIRLTAHTHAQIGLYLLEDILQRRRSRHT